MTREDILHESKLTDGGTFSNILEELEECGFIRRFASADTAEANALFQLTDNYTLFYYLCIKKMPSATNTIGLTPSRPHHITSGRDMPLNEYACSTFSR